MFKLIATATILVCVYAASVPVKLSEPNEQPKTDSSVKSQPLHHPARHHDTHEKSKAMNNVQKVAPVKENLKESPKSQIERININGKNHALGQETQKSQSLHSQHKQDKNSHASLKQADAKSEHHGTQNGGRIPVKIMNEALSKQAKPEKNGKMQENKKDDKKQ